MSLHTVPRDAAKRDALVRDIDSHAASRRMQAHYDQQHVDDLTRLGYPPRTREEGTAR